MGGYGALRVGLAHSERFCSIHSNAGSLDRSVEFKLNATKRSAVVKNRSQEFILEMRRVFGEQPNGTSHDVLKHAVNAKRRGTLPKLWIDCGTDDYLIEGNRAFHRDLEAAQIPHAYHEFPGSHGWEYCNDHIGAALAFHSANMGISPDSTK